MEVFSNVDNGTVTPYANTWDARFNDKDLPDGAYYYIITLPGRDVEPYNWSYQPNKI